MITKLDPAKDLIPCYADSHSPAGTHLHDTARQGLERNHTVAVSLLESSTPQLHSVCSSLCKCGNESRQERYTHLALHAPRRDMLAQRWDRSPEPRLNSGGPQLQPCRWRQLVCKPELVGFLCCISNGVYFPLSKTACGLAETGKAWAYT